LVDPQSVSLFLNSFLKQFCLSLRFIKDSAEKREAFTGLCSSIIHNPNGVMNFFAFFCDAICQYEDAPEELESFFQKIIHSYKNTLKDKWMDYFKSFPERLKKKMNNRFRLLD
jgi:transportin-1